MIDRLAQEALLDGEPYADVVTLHNRLGGQVGAWGLAFRFRRQEMAGVFVLRVGEDFRRRASLNDLALRHHTDAVGDLAHDAEIVRDEQHGQAPVALQISQEFKDLRLYGDVERRGWLVGDQELRLVGKGHGDHDALALAARKLVREGVEALFWFADADLVQEFERAGASLLAAHATVQLEDFAHLLLDRVQRIERGHRLLED